MRFYLLDRVTECEPGKLARGVKNVTLSEDFLDEHFAGIPIMPGTLILEGLAQLSGYLLARTASPDAPHKHKAVLSMVEKAKFRQVVRPGDQLKFEARLVTIRDDSGKVDASATVEGEVVVSAQLVFYFADLKNDLLEANRREIFSIWTTGASE
ncbi:MAG: 3-hydroxyacyl-ACP dehydratase FabZ [Candidatus Riflebacteria bacterium]|nr:3-hydroxyacyl-ACP dehydratase FabZ [Candidatus Riflebacteria bacterium]